MLTAITTIVARFNAISQGLSTAPDRHAPIFRKTDDSRTLPHLCCMGFPTGMRFRMDAWQPLLDLNRVDHGLPLPILLYGRDYWNSIVNFQGLVDEGVISPHDLDLIHWTDDAQEGWDFVTNYY